MKNLYFILIFLLTISVCNAQIVNIPDANFKNALVNSNCVDTNGDGIGDSDADLNNDGEIQVSEAEAVLRLHIDSENINSLEGIQSFTNLEKLDCSFNQLSSLNITQSHNLYFLSCYNNQLMGLDVSQNPNIEFLYCYNNQLTNLDISQNPNLLLFSCNRNQLTNLDVSQNLNIEFLSCWENQLTSLDVSQNLNLNFLSCLENQLTSLNLKNGNNMNLITMLATDNPNLSCIQVDNVDFANIAFGWEKDATAEYSENCELGTGDYTPTHFTLYPNPTHTTLNIETLEQLETIKIYSLQGVLVKEVSNVNNIDVSRLASGMYFIQLSADGKTTTKKFIKE